MPSDHSQQDWRKSLVQLSEQLSVAPEDQWKAQVVINSFRQGSPPHEMIEQVTVGLGAVKKRFDLELRRARDGGCSFTLLEGPYGSGKSHSLYLLRHKALEAGYLVSLVTLSQRECPLFDLGLIYASIVGSISGKASTGVTSLRDLLEIWAETVRRRGLSSVESAEHAVKQLHPDLQSALAEIVGEVSQEKAESAERWLTGTDRTKTTARKLGVALRATNEDALLMLKELGILVCYLGFRGLVVLLDEAESVPAYSTASRRAKCYENLRQLLDRRNRVPHCYFVYATTPLFFSKTHGRMPVSRQSEEVLELPAMTPGDRFRLGQIIRDLYLKAECRLGLPRSLGDTELRKCLDGRSLPASGDLRPRLFVRSLVAAFDLCAQNPKVKLTDTFDWCDDEQ